MVLEQVILCDLVPDNPYSIGVDMNKLKHMYTVHRYNNSLQHNINCWTNCSLELLYIYFWCKVIHGVVMGIGSNCKIDEGYCWLI